VEVQDSCENLKKREKKEQEKKEAKQMLIEL